MSDAGWRGIRDRDETLQESGLFDARHLSVDSSEPFANPGPSLAEEGDHAVVAEAGAGGQGHDQLEPMFGSFYAHAVNGSTLRHRSAPRKRTCAL